MHTNSNKPLKWEAGAKVCIDYANSLISHHDHPPADVTVSRCTVRVRTTVWADNRGLHTRKSLTFLRRQCEGFNVLAEDASAIGAEKVLPRILNLGEVEDGIYEVIVCNKTYDYETGYIEDYDYRLVTPSASVTDAELAKRPR